MKKRLLVQKSLKIFLSVFSQNFIVFIDKILSYFLVAAPVYTEGIGGSDEFKHKRIYTFSHTNLFLFKLDENLFDTIFRLNCIVLVLSKNWTIMPSGVAAYIWLSAHFSCQSAVERFLSNCQTTVDTSPSDDEPR